jgi:hypothetical protein
MLTYLFRSSYICLEAGNKVAEDEVLVAVAGREFVKPGSKDL